MSLYERFVSISMDLLNCIPCINTPSNETYTDETYTDFDDNKTWSSNMWVGGIKQDFRDADTTVFGLISITEESQ